MNGRQDRAKKPGKNMGETNARAIYFRHHPEISFVLKMDTYPDRKEHESCAKRIKLDLREPEVGVLCNESSFSNFSTSIEGPIDANEGKNSKICFDCLGKIFHPIWRPEQKANYGHFVGVAHLDFLVAVYHFSVHY